SRRARRVGRGRAALVAPAGRAARAMIHAAHTELWTQWGGDLSSAIGIAATVAVYGAGARTVWQHAGRGHGIQRWHVTVSAGGLATLALALLSPIDALAGD